VVSEDAIPEGVRVEPRASNISGIRRSERVEPRAGIRDYGIFVEFEIERIGPHPLPRPSEVL